MGIYVPGRGVMYSDELALERELKEYDPDLSLGKDGDQYVVMMNRGDQPFPVLGLGFQLPSLDRIKQLLFETDARRHGSEIAARIDRHNEAIKKELRRKTAEGAEEFGEAMDTAYHVMKRNPRPRIFVPSGKDS